MPRAGARTPPSRNRALRRLANRSPKKFSELAVKMPVFGELQNLFDLAVLTALMRREEMPKKANWQPNLFLDETRAPVLRGPVPKQTKTMMNTKNTNKGLVIGLLNGGVIIDSQKIVSSTDTSTQAAAEVSSRRSKSTPAADMEAKRWWWD